MTQHHPSNRRWYGFTRVENALQIRHVSRIVVCAAIYVVLSSAFFLAFYVERVGAASGDLHRLTLGWILSMTGMSALFALLVGLYVTRRIAGPLHRIKSDLVCFLDGDESARVRLRGRDEMTDLADMINRVLEAKAGGESARGSPSLSELRAELRKIAEEIRTPGAASSASSETIEELAERLEALAAPAGSPR